MKEIVTGGLIYRPCQCCFELIYYEALLEWTYIELIGGQIVVLFYQLCTPCYEHQLSLVIEKRVRGG